MKSMPMHSNRTSINGLGRKGAFGIAGYLTQRLLLREEGGSGQVQGSRLSFPWNIFRNAWESLPGSIRCSFILQLLQPDVMHRHLLLVHHSKLNHHLASCVGCGSDMPN